MTTTLEVEEVEIWENRWEYESLSGFQEYKAFEGYRLCGLFHGFLKKVRKVDCDEGFVRNLNFLMWVL